MDFLMSPAVPVIEAAIGAAFLISAIRSINFGYVYASSMFLVPSLVDGFTSLLPGVIEYPVYYFSLSSFAMWLMVKCIDYRRLFAGKAFFLLTAICAILAVVTTYVQLSPDGLDASLLGLVFVLSWWALDGLVIWMAINGDFNGNGADPC